MGRWVEWVRAATPTDAVRGLAASIALAGFLVASVVVLHLDTRPLQPTLNRLLQVALAALWAGAITRLCLSRASIRLPKRIDRVSFVSYVSALQAGLLLCVVPLILYYWKTRSDVIGGWTYPFLNKRWLAALYGLGIFTILVLPALFRRILAARGFHHGLPTSEGTPEPAARHGYRQPPWRRAAELMVVGAVIWFFVGPPWRVERHHRGIDWHEQVHLGPLQAIDKGYLPFIGPASTQYGPGSQAFTYAYMKLAGPFTIVTFREAFLAIHLATFLLVGAAAYVHAGFRASLVTIVLGMAYSPLSFFYQTPDGSMGESYGWGNAARYVGALVVVPGLALLVTASPARRSRTILLGLAWGVLAWISQENFSATITGGGLLLTLLWLSESITTQQLARLCIDLALGFLCFWTPVLAYYAAHGSALAFIRNYFLVAQAVAAGYSNTWWLEPQDPATRAFFYTPAVILAVGVLTLCDLRSLRLRTRLEPAQVRLLAFVCVLAACYQTALFRSDGSHLRNTLIALPFVVVLTIRDLPAWAVSSWPSRLVVRAVVLGAVLYIYPLSEYLGGFPETVGQAWTHRFTTFAPGPPVVAPEQIPFRRATAALSDEPEIVSSGGPMRKFLEDATALRTLIGDRPTYVEGATPYYTGLVYFMLDLKPAPFLFDKETMIINDAIFEQHVAYFRARIHEVKCLVVRSMAAEEAQAFIAAYPHAVAVHKTLGTASVIVMLAGSEPQ